jgi:hypothetical protein
VAYRASLPAPQHIGLSCWDRHVSYRSMSIQPPLDWGGLAAAQRAAAAAGGPSAVPPLFDLTCSAIVAALTPSNACGALSVAELLLPTTHKLYRQVRFGHCASDGWGCV